MQITHSEATLYLNRWLLERTPLNVCFVAPNLNTQCCFAGRVSAIDQKLVLSHSSGNSEAYLTCSWDAVKAIDYIELRESAEKLEAIPGAAEFMRERTNIVLVLKNDMIVLLTDLTIDRDGGSESEEEEG